MTGNEVLKFALALMGEDESAAADYAGYSISQLNILLSEVFPVANSLLPEESKLLLPVQINTLKDTILYPDRLLRECVSYGLAAKLVLEDGDYSRFNYLNSMYIEAQNSLQKAEKLMVYDVYGDSEE